MAVRSRGDFAIDDPADLSYHQHAPEWQDGGTLLLYGNGRPGTASGPGGDGAPPFCRAAQYRLEPDAGTAEVVWEHVSQIDGAPVFAGFVGDADHLANGKVLVVDGGLGGDRADDVTAQLVEVDPGDDTVVWELRVAEPGRDIAVYRAERIASLHGG